MAGANAAATAQTSAQPSVAEGRAKPTAPEHSPPELMVPQRALRSFDRVATNELPQHSITALVQDDEGVLWVGTFDGVATFDGVDMAPVPTVQDAPWRGPTYALLRRQGGGIYVASAEGLHVFDGRSWRLWKTPKPAVSLAQEDALWMVDDGGGLWRGEPGSLGEWRAQGLPGAVGPAVAVATAGDGTVIVAGRSGIVRLRADGSLEAPMGAAFSSPLTALLVTRSGTCWVGTTDGEILFARTGGTRWQRVTKPGWEGGRITALAEDQAGSVWAGGRNGSVCHGSEAGSWALWGPDQGLKASTVTALLADREGSLWFGYITNGLQQWVGAGWSHRTSLRPGRADTARVVIPGIAGTSGGGALIAAFDKGLWHWDGRALRLYGREHGLTEDVRYAVEPEPGTLWVAARFGILESHRGAPFRKVHGLGAGLVTAFFRAPGGDWYATTSSEGVLSRDAAGWRPDPSLNSQLPHSNVRGMTWLKNGDLWVASFGGVTVFRGGRGRTLAPDAATDVPRQANTVLEVGDDVWVGAAGGIGIWHAGRWRVLTEANGLPGHTIYSLIRGSDGSIWAGGSNGVGRMKGGRWTVYGSHNGLVDGECNVNALWEAPDGSVWVGTMGSLARFDPLAVALPAAPLRVFWRRTPPVGPDGTARIPAGNRSLHLGWAAPWLLPQALEYRVRVPRLSPSWSQPQRNRELSFDNLAAGRWDIEVAARLAGSELAAWSAPRSLHVVIEPHAWETAGGRMLLLALAGLAVWGVVHLRTIRLKRQAQELERGIRAGLARIKVLTGLLPICASCKRIRDDHGYWSQIESYIHEHSDADFSHGVCPDCMERLYPEIAAKLKAARPGDTQPE